MKRTSVLLPTLLLLVIWGLLSYRLSTPLFGNQDAGRIWIASSVQNYERYGLEHTGLMVVRSVEPTTPDNLAFYSHHPPLVTWLPALFTRLVGFHELGIRWVFAAATLIGAAGLYSFARYLYGRSVAFWALAAYGLVPMVAYFGRVAGHDPLGLMAALLFGAVLVRWLDYPTRGRYAALLALAVLAVWTAWPAVFFVALLGLGALLLGLGALLLGGRTHRLGVVGIGIVTLVAFAAMMLFYQLQWSGSIDSLLDAFVWRSSSARWTEGSQAFTLQEFFEVNLRHLRVHTTDAVLVLGLAGLLVLPRYGNRRGNVMLFALLLGGVTYLLVFRNAAFIHDYYKLVLIPAVAVSAGLAWVYLPRLLPGARVISRLALLAVAVWAVSEGSAQFLQLHRSGVRPALQAVIDLVKTGTREGDLVYTNSRTPWDFVLPVEYYAFRNLVEYSDLETAEAQVAASGVPAFYLYCPSQNNQVDIPPALWATRRSAGNCHLMSLDAG